MIFFEVKGKNGSEIIPRIDEMCRDMNIIVLTLSGSSLIIFQGSSSAKYLLPILAIFINSEQASLNLKLFKCDSILIID